MRPDSVTEYKDLDLKLGIKSSLPNVKSTLGLLILMWNSCGKKAELNYSEEKENEIIVNDEVLNNVKNYLISNGVEISDLEDTINSNQLFKSQLEALIVAFELVWRLAKIRFNDSTKPSSAERTGGKRYTKVLYYTSNMDIVGVVIDGNPGEYAKVLAKWIGLSSAVNPKFEDDLEKILTALSEDAVFKLTDGTTDVVFNQNEVYKKLNESEDVDINGDKEAKGSLRILKSLLADGLNPYLRYSGGTVSAVDDGHSELGEYQKRVDNYLALSTKRIFLEDETMNIEDDTENPEERNKRLFRYWMELQVKPEGDSDAGNPYSKTSIDQYVSNIANTQLVNTPDKSVFYTTDTGEVEIVIEYLDNAEKKNNTQRSAVKKYLEYLIEAPSEEDIEEVFSHNVYGFHIKAKNDSLSDQNPHVCIGWSDMGDMTSLDSRESVAEEYDKHYDKSANAKGQDVGQIWRFINDVQIGDYVIYAESSVFHIGRVESDFYYDNTVRPEQDADYTNNRKVRWIKKNLSRKMLSDNLHNSLKTAMSIWTLNDYKSAVADLIRGTYKKDDATDMDEMLEIKFKTEIETEYERNRIVFGAPGTGKSFGLKQDSEKMLEGTSGYFERVTFHPDYSYSQFVGTYKPIMDMEGNIRYDFVPGPFMRVYVNALKNGASGNPQPNLLLIEEINRAKVAAVFGDVFQLLDRDEDGVSEYEIQTSEDIRKYLMKELHVTEDKVEKIRIPDNMFIWATMNSADQGVFPMDTAFKRRWNFEYLGINESQDEISGIGKIVLADSEELVEWNVLRKAINEKMSSSDFKINEDKLMGPFFLSKKVIASDDDGMIKDPGKFIDAFKSKVIMYLYEDAVKQGKHRFFDGCTDTGKYSSVCDEFDRIGLGIFGSTFRELYYDRQRDEA